MRVLEALILLTALGILLTGLYVAAQTLNLVLLWALGQI